MNKKKRILAINGSASANSSNLILLGQISNWLVSKFEVTIYDDLTALPHFQTELTDNDTPPEALLFRKLVNESDGIIICTPEYVFSIPSRLKNAIEWCVSTTVFSNKPISLITASASGEKGHEELKLIMRTVEARFSDDTTLLIQGVRGKVKNGEIIHEETRRQLRSVIDAFVVLFTRDI